MLLRWEIEMKNSEMWGKVIRLLEMMSSSGWSLGTLVSSDWLLEIMVISNLSFETWVISDW